MDLDGTSGADCVERGVQMVTGELGGRFDTSFAGTV